MSDLESDMGLDLESIKAKYNAERDKRLRADGNAQYVHPEGKFSHFLDDPYTEWKPRKAITEEVDVLILGGGFGGLLAGARLHEAGIDDIRLVEKGGDFGGTWYWNRYPGAACDTESYVYLPLLEEVGYIPTRKYAFAPEIAEQARRIGKTFDLYGRTLFQTEITEFEWDDARMRWLVKTDRDDKIFARFVVICSGHYHKLKLPGIPGLESFKGHTFHTSRWDYEYTGGDINGGLTKLHDKTVGIIGTGATAVQCVPHLGEGAKQLYVFQRTPSAVDVRNDHPTDPEWAKSLKPGWQKERMDNFTGIIFGVPAEKDLVNDGWTKPFFEVMQKAPPDITLEQRAELLKLTDFKVMEAVRARVDNVVKDKATAEALKPWYARVCKRACFHDQYLQTFNRPNVKLVDTEGHGVERITENGLVVAGTEYKVDCIVYATGFDLGALSGLELNVRGRNGLSLTGKWKDGAITLHGIQSHDFPNFFVMSTMQSAWDANFVHMLDVQARHVSYIIEQVKKRGAKTVEATAEAEREWVAIHEKYAEFTKMTWAECTPSYFNNEGQLSPVILRNAGFGAGAPAFIDILAKWREAGDLKGLELK